MLRLGSQISRGPWSDYSHLFPSRAREVPRLPLGFPLPFCGIRSYTGAMPLDAYLEAFAKLRCGRVGDHLRPHKPVVLLAVMELFEGGEQIENRIEFQSLLEPSARYFEVVRESDDQCTPINPYFYMRSEGFWRHQPRPGQEAVLQAMSNPPGVAGLLEIIDHVKLDDELHRLLCSAQNREILRQTIIGTYFAKHRETLNALGFCGA